MCFVFLLMLPRVLVVILRGHDGYLQFYINLSSINFYHFSFYWGALCFLIILGCLILLLQPSDFFLSRFLVLSPWMFSNGINWVLIHSFITLWFTNAVFLYLILFSCLFIIGPWILKAFYPRSSKQIRLSNVPDRTRNSGVTTQETSCWSVGVSRVQFLMALLTLLLNYAVKLN